MKHQRVIITGGAGFIGSNIAEELSKDNEVIIIDDLSSGRIENIELLTKRSNVSFVQGSITELSLLQKAFAGADCVFHHAALVSVVKSIENPLQANEVNILGTLNVLVAARHCGVRKLICASSSAVYGNTAALPVREDITPDPQSPYAITKLTAEYYCRVFTRLYALPTICLRYFNVYGVRQNPDAEYAAVIPSFIGKALRGRPLTIYGDGTQTRDFVFVKDVVQANIAAADSAAEGIYNLGTGVETTVQELAETVTLLTGRSPEIIHEPARPGEVKRSRADISRANDFGYHPRYDLTTGLRETIDWFASRLT
jgi:UDP-glucose 4-epimerase